MKAGAELSWEVFNDAVKKTIRTISQVHIR